jgi:hypothetical protein
VRVSWTDRGIIESTSRWTSSSFCMPSNHCSMTPPSGAGRREILVDKVGISDWEDRKARKVVVRGTMLGQTIHHGIMQGCCLCFHCWRITHPLHYCIARFSLGPRAAQKARYSIRNGFEHEVECKAYINAEIFFDYVETVFLSNLVKLRWVDEEIGGIYWRNSRVIAR